MSIFYSFLPLFLVGLADKNAAFQIEQKGCRLCAFKCEGEGVYQDVNDRSPRHEERAQDAPLSSVWWEEVDSNHRSLRRQIYSLMHLATLQSARISCLIGVLELVTGIEPATC